MNQPARRNPVASFFIGLWDVMNFTRRLILNLVFFGLLLLILILFVVAMGKGASSGSALQDRTTLVIAPEGRLVEQFSADPVSRASVAWPAGTRRARQPAPAPPPSRASIRPRLWPRIPRRSCRSPRSPWSAGRTRGAA